MAVVGAGASGSEIASAYARLGVEVLLFEALSRVLPTEDADISKLAERGLKKQGMEIHTGTLVQEIESGEKSVNFTFGERRGRGRVAGDRRRPRPRRRGSRASTRRASSATSTGWSGSTAH